MESSTDVYRKLQRHIDNMPVAFPESESGLDIKLLKHLFTPEEAKMQCTKKYLWKELG